MVSNSSPGIPSSAGFAPVVLEYIDYKRVITTPEQWSERDNARGTWRFRHRHTPLFLNRLGECSLKRISADHVSAL